jgi:hypothetical protein
VTKLSQTGSLVWSTFYGSPSGANGGNNNGVTAIAVDSSSNVYITGGADGQGDLPLNNSLQSYNSGVAFVTELNSSGSQVLFGTFYGGGADIYPTTLVLDASSNIYFAGYTAASLPLVNPLQSTNSGGSNQGFFAKIAIAAPQTITFGPLPNVTYGAAPFTVSATASSGLGVGFNSQTTQVCTVSGAAVTLVSVGSCTIQATQTGNANYLPATPVNRSFQVTRFGPCDIQQSGNINVGDVQLVINEALGVTVAANDLSGNGVVDVLDVQIEVNAALSLGCVTK